MTQHEIQQATEKAKAAFPKFADWEYDNGADEDFFGFSLWGEFSPDPDPEDLSPKVFFITLDTYKDEWSGHLTIGRHSYLWTSADFGDAHLIDTEPCETIEDAITSLKTEMTNLFRAFSAI
ncbi:hypothetical protein QUF72_08405 [Desulfobacterales bacterium HSG2]|nr:hypothetical protein [Desulfobacterales bacterium HSG2]